jgi:hypothetical protein
MPFSWTGFNSTSNTEGCSSDAWVLLKVKTHQAEVSISCQMQEPASPAIRSLSMHHDMDRHPLIELVFGQTQFPGKLHKGLLRPLACMRHREARHHE